MIKRLMVAAALFVASVWAYGTEPQRVSILGDSYSTFLGAVQPAGNEVWYYPTDPEEKTDVTAVEKTWWHIFLEHSGMKLERNNSYSGSTVCHRGYNGEDYSRRSFITRMNDLGSPDLILVFGATNDHWAGVALTPEGRGAAEPHSLYTFRPAMDYMLQQLGVLYPGARVVVMLNDIIDGPVRDAVIEICAARGVECLQLKDISKRMGHPDSEGMREIAAQLSDFLTSADRKI